MSLKLRWRWWCFEPNALSYILMPESCAGCGSSGALGRGRGADLSATHDFLRWDGRRMGVLAEYVISTAWCYAMVFTWR